ncbi:MULTISPECIES: ATP-binding cassette domain-containing protein [Rhodopseudomonas]|uniref:Urea ABC transporter ATP-binding protein n=1 Tax=Rhodopseudomonas palustris TaxID=1076 RepID=A0A0D7F475_RHOPL|nr:MULTISPECIES: ATP-binding cassette domain-containing protein [Rhodopseudomonas]KIZ47858.1 urea ABC transporter ATP-binding protein [Rhodopseudomonas palustris]MDF3813776.1 ATP-binding cassette domain-containing protein [Rhodopseudomonas sp. BAL398]WOK17661.1 ATP-binding cassette domain-containing protein [Rhodopseudomonas sp. BAL398]
MAVALLIDNVTVEFGSFRAIDALSLAIDFGEVRAVIGPNGAGKTTMLDVISGITRARQGQVMFDESIDITRSSEAAIARAGVRRKFQKPSIFEGLDVRQHIAIGAQGGLRRTLAPAALDQRVDEVLEAIGLSDLAQRSASELAHGQKQWLEIGMVLASNPKVLMLDEPVAGLTDEETERTVALVRKLKRPDRAIVVVEHDMDFVERIADRVTVLHEGKTLFEGSMRDARADERVVDVYLGR